MQSNRIISYAQIAAMMGVKVPSVRLYAYKDPDFPEPVTPPEFRSPGFDQQEIQDYIKLRNSRTRGRAPRTADNAPRIDASPELGKRIRALMNAAEPRVTAQSLADDLGINVQMFGFRMRGQVRWKQSELETVAQCLGTTITALRAEIEDQA